VNENPPKDKYKFELENGNVIEGVKSANFTRGNLHQILFLDKLTYQVVAEQEVREDDD
jgi:hypothetical protein